jgi:phosphopantetheinyl transferase (holo-ACP synthase)
MKVWIVWDDEDYAYTGKVYATKEAAVKAQQSYRIEEDDVRFEEVEVIA